MEMGVRLGAACLMTAASAWGGRMLAGAQARRTEALREMLGGVRRLQVDMLDRRLPLGEALKACGGALMAATAERMAEGLAPEEACGEAAAGLRERGGPLDCLEEGDMAAVKRLFGGLGEGGLEKQRVLLKDTEEELERLLRQARRKREEQGKLYASLGALGGLAMALLLL